MKRDDAISRMQTFKAICDRFETSNFEKTPLFEHKKMALNIVKTVIDEVPAVDLTPMTHGRWEDKGSLSCRCSRCGCKSNNEYKYCPHCGAKMDGGENGAEQ